jgi:prepilin peptidase CpaA
MSTEVIFFTFLVTTSAAFFDLRTRRIPNALPLVACAFALAWHTWQGGPEGFWTSLGGLGAGVAFMLPGWLLRFTGGGDVKLLAAVGSLLGPATVVHAFVLSILAGAIIAAVYGLYAWARLGAASPVPRYGSMIALFLSTGRLSYARPSDGEAMGRRFPLAPAIAIGSVVAAIWFP